MANYTSNYTKTYCLVVLFLSTALQRPSSVSFRTSAPANSCNTYFQPTDVVMHYGLLCGAHSKTQ